MAKLVSKIVEIWHDRKRILGMPISFTRYALSEDRLFLRRGFLNVRHDEYRAVPCARSAHFGVVVAAHFRRRLGDSGLDG